MHGCRTWQNILKQEKWYILRSQSKFHMKEYDHHQTLHVRVGLPRLRPYCGRPFASNCRSNFCAFPSSPLRSHVFFQRTMYSVPDTVSLLSSILMISHSGSSICAASPCPWTCSTIGRLVIVPLVGPERMVALRISGLTTFDSGEVPLAWVSRCWCWTANMFSVERQTGHSLSQIEKAYFTLTLTASSFILMRWQTAAAFDMTLRRRFPLNGRQTPFLYRLQQRRSFLVVVPVRFLFIFFLVIYLRFLAVARILLVPIR